MITWLKCLIIGHISVMIKKGSKGFPDYYRCERCTKTYYMSKVY